MTGPEQDLITRLIGNMGDNTPMLLVVFMFMRYMWPRVAQLIELALEVRKAAPHNVPVIVTLDISENLAAAVAVLGALGGVNKPPIAFKTPSATTAASPAAATASGSVSGAGALGAVGAELAARPVQS